MAANRLRQSGRDSPASRATSSEPSPEKSPLTCTICTALFWERARVQLFSSPQQRQAPSTSSEPGEKRRLCAPSKESSMLAAVIRKIAHQTRREIRSRNSSRANSEVATISKLLSSDTWAAGARASPSISKMGAAISSRIIPSVKGSCRRVSRSFRGTGQISESSVIPTPAPRYSSAASITGPVCRSRKGESGMLTAYSRAAPSAAKIAVLFCCTVPDLLICGFWSPDRPPPQRRHRPAAHNQRP